MICPCTWLFRECIYSLRWCYWSPSWFISFSCSVPSLNFRSWDTKFLVNVKLANHCLHIKEWTFIKTYTKSAKSLVRNWNNWQSQNYTISWTEKDTQELSKSSSWPCSGTQEWWINLISSIPFLLFFSFYHFYLLPASSCFPSY